MLSQAQSYCKLFSLDKVLRLEKEVSDLTHQVKVSNKKVVHPLDSDPSNAIITEDVDDEFVDEEEHG